MADAGQVKVVILETGKRLFSTAFAGVSVVNTRYFEIADTANFEGNSSYLAPVGNIVFSGDSTLMETKLITPDSVRYTINLPEDVGPFPVGNIVIYGALPNNILTPLFHVIFPFVYQKTISVVGGTLPNGLPSPGSRLTINISVRHLFDSGNIQVYVEFPDYANIPAFDNESSIPDGPVNPWNAFLVNKSNFTKAPILGAKDATNNTQWGMPLWNRLTDPEFNILGGGLEGDGYNVPSLDYTSGGFYLTKETAFKGYVGGASYTASDADFFEDIGGAPYSPIT